ncbi:hypothetical protein LTSEMIN_1273 [Salmonella enterica subsp. enterica serovar Minnesota str. A4-603]|nr:hypothetical protein LTSEMIN_1273 [Salmonella enterica subsp. enterica serovar Minnesota str. A4-603]
MGTLTAGLLVADAVLLVGRAGALFSNGEAGRGSAGLASRFGCSSTFFTGFGFGLGFGLGLGFSITTGASLGGSGIGSGSGSGSTTGSGGG